MKDQVDALRQSGVAAAAINSTIPRDEQRRLLGAAADGGLRLLYVAPERFSDGAFMSALRGLRVTLFAIDEAHCVSQWGHDFRPSYRDLAAVRQSIGDPPIVALTATADALVRADIVERLELRDPEVHVAGFDRPNLRFDVVRVKTQKEKADLIGDRLAALGGQSAVVYCATRKKVETLAESLQRRGLRCARYHAGMEDDDRRRIQEAFQRDSLPVIVATNAFGMGIDKPDVRLVLHHDMPDSLDSYYQEAGRAGRDGEPAECILYYTPRDRGLREFFIELSHPEPEAVLEVYRTLVAHSGDRVHVRDLAVGDEEGPVNAAVQALVDSGLAERKGYTARALRPNGESEIDLASLEAHRDRALDKLDAMQRYAESATCLRAVLLGYFGDEETPKACGNCGPCMAPPPPAKAVVDAASEDLFQQLRALRRELADEAGVPPYVIFSDATLRDMATRRPCTRHEMLQVSGVGQVKWDRYGEGFLAITSAAPPAAAEPSPQAPSNPRVPLRDRHGNALPDTVRVTWDLLREGHPLADIAATRRLSPATIAGHVASLVERGEVDDISPWVDEDTVARVAAAAAHTGMEKLAPLHQALGESVTFDQLRIARAYLAR
jgi:ATP-dependent DNA helicase RecQ